MQICGAWSWKHEHPSQSRKALYVRKAFSISQKSFRKFLPLFSHFTSPQNINIGQRWLGLRGHCRANCRANFEKSLVRKNKSGEGSRSAGNMELNNIDKGGPRLTSRGNFQTIVFLETDIGGDWTSERGET